MDLKDLKCEPCKGGTPSLNHDEIIRYAAELKTDWKVIGDVSIERMYTFKDYKFTMNFVNKVAGLAEEENHHPDMHVYYGKVSIELSTHSVGGLSLNDFILAAKIEAI